MSRMDSPGTRLWQPGESGKREKRAHEQGVPTMATQVALKTKAKEEATPRTGALMPRRELPFFVSEMRDDLDRLFDRFFQHFPTLFKGDGWRWGLDIRDEDDTVVVRAEAPGFDAGDFDIKVTDDRLVLRAAKKVESKDKEGKLTETREQECFESLTLPPGIDKDKVDARYRNGVLTITFPRTAEGKARRVPVKDT